MLKSNMEFIDVVFPLSLNPLTYKCPEYLRDKAVPGMLVSAPLKNRIIRGIILGEASTPVTDTIKPISDIHGDTPLLEQPMLKLLNWMSDYYLANKGIILKNMLPKEAFKKVKARGSLKIERKAISGQLSDINEDILLKIIKSSEKKEYKTFLLHTPTSLHEISFLIRLLQSQKNAIILVPEIIHIGHITPLMRDVSGDRLCILHSGLSSGQRSEAIEKIVSDDCNVVLGTRAAVFAPLKNVSLIVAMQEHSSSYRSEEGLRYNARDIAVMRGYLEKATVMLSSICPSIESLYNVRKNKYTLLKPSIDYPKPRIRIVNMHNERQPARNLSKTVIDAAISSVKKQEQIMFVINRKGYSMLTCRDCNHTEVCAKCSIPLIFHKNDKTLRCHYCASKFAAPEKCKRCGSFDLELAGSGIQRVEEDIRKLFHTEPVRLDSDRIKRKKKAEDLTEMIKGETIILGTKLLTKRLDATARFGMAAVLNADIYLNLPDFRTAEKAYQELSAIAEKIRPEGTLFIQTKMPQNYLFKCIKDYDYPSFLDEELSRRKAMLYPPFSKLALITLKGKGYNDDKVRDAVKTLLSNNKDLEILGPALSSERRRQEEYNLLFKTTLKKNLHSYLKDFLKIFELQKDLKIAIAIDP